MPPQTKSLDEEVDTEKPAKGGKGFLIWGLVLLLLAGGGLGAWMMMGGKQDAKKTQVVEKLPPRYITLDPPFVVNFASESAVRFLQVTVGVMTRDPAVESLVKENDPRVRNDLLMILGNQTYAAVSSVEGKEQLRQRSLDSVRAIVKEMGGNPEKVEALYFTSFVMQ